jgi:predicted DNA-binding transcriptional regulator AlpA
MAESDTMTTEAHLSAREVARHLGVKTATLAKWRYLGKGPKGWIKLSETHVAYPVAELEAWKAECAAAPPRSPVSLRVQPKGP